MKSNESRRRQFGRSERTVREQEVLTEGAMEINPDELRARVQAGERIIALQSQLWEAREEMERLAPQEDIGPNIQRNADR